MSRGVQPAPHAAAAKLGPFELLKHLSEQQDSRLPVDVALQSCRAGILEFSDMLKTMVQTGLISVEGPPGDEVLRLTEHGSTMAQLSR